MKEYFRKQHFLKNLDLLPNKNSRSKTDQGNENSICEQFCFYYFDDDEHVICRGCYKRFETWLKFRMHFNTLLCYSTEINYKLNTYNDVYKKYKLRKTKPKKKIDRLSVELMDLETLNTRKTRKKCYNNARVAANVSKSPSDSGSSISEKTVMMKEEDFENFVRSYESIEEGKQKVTDSKTVQVQDIPNSTKAGISNLPHDNQTTLTVKIEWNADDISQASSYNQSSNSVYCLSKYIDKKNKLVEFHYVCVICEEQFMSKCLLTMHQVQHIQSDRSCYGVFMAALGRSA